MTNSEKKILKKIRNETSRLKDYMFWFIYDNNDCAVTYEGGYELQKDIQFRNDYIIPAGKNKRVKLYFGN